MPAVRMRLWLHCLLPYDVCGVTVLIVFHTVSENSLSEVWHRLGWKLPWMYGTCGYNKCWKWLPQACDRGHICHMKCFSAPCFLHRYTETFHSLCILENLCHCLFSNSSLIFQTICFRCIRKMDHHCPWVNNCVGENNQKYFVLFTVSQHFCYLMSCVVFCCMW